LGITKAEKPQSPKSKFKSVTPKKSFFLFFTSDLPRAINKIAGQQWDVSTYFDALSGRASTGFTNVTPAVKWQISPLPGKIDLSAVFGAGLPTGTKAVAGPGVQPYVQFPWSWELGSGWGLSGMLTNFIVPADPVNKLSTQTTFVIEREIGKQAFLFVEYVGDYHIHGGPGYLVNSGGGYRITNTQQIDFHIGIGLNDNAPSYIFGVGYSFRFDRLF
jgi:hypothetical protein